MSNKPTTTVCCDPKFLRRPIANLIFKSVGELHKELGFNDRLRVIEQLRIATERYEAEVLNVYDVRVFLYNHYNTLVTENRSRASLSRDFNMSIRNHNSKLEALVDTLMRKAFTADIECRSGDAIEALREVRLRYPLLYDEKLINMSTFTPSPNLEAARVQLEWINKYRDSLFKSIVKMAVNLARKHKKPLSGEVVSESDLIQEAVLAAQHHVNLYQPIEDGVTFTSYMYQTIDHHLSHYVNENTRTVALPRTIIDRYRPVYQAIEQVGSANLERVAQQATRNLYELKQESSGRKLDREEADTPQEVHQLITYTQEALSLHDENWASLPFSTITSQVDVINVVDTSPTQEEKLDKANVMTQLMGVVQECASTSEEYMIMEIRYGMGEHRGLQTTARIYKNATGRPMNKGKVAEIERRVLARMKQHVADGDPRLVELKKVVEALF